MKKNILMILSDQHNGYFVNYENKNIDTPNIEKIASEGRAYNHAYCNSPLCVPSRMSLLSGKMPSDLCIFNNDTTLTSDIPTIAHYLGSEGYKTVLIGRMHFKGDDQNHGFDERLVGDITSEYWGTGGKNRLDFKDYAGTTNRKNCLKEYGYGVSPVMLFDEAVYQKSLEYLDNLNDGPYFIVCGFYGPHFPYTCSKELYEKYMSKDIDLPDLSAKPYYSEYVLNSEDINKKSIFSSYAGMVETLDTYVGGIYSKFKEKFSEDDVFIYTSDHGEQFGKRDIYGKTTFYEDSIKIPMLIKTKGVDGIDSKTVSLLDLTKTILDIAEVENDFKGENLFIKNDDASVKIEGIIKTKEKKELAEAVIRWPYKLFKIGETIELYDLSKDPNELNDLSDVLTLVKEELEKQMLSEERKQWCLSEDDKQEKRHKVLAKWGSKKKVMNEKETFYVDSSKLVTPIK